MQGICDSGEVLNEASVVLNETLDGHICCGFRIFGDGFQVTPAWPYKEAEKVLKAVPMIPGDNTVFKVFKEKEEDW